MGLSMILSAAADINVSHPARMQGRRFGDYRNAFRNSGTRTGCDWHHVTRRFSRASVSGAMQRTLLAFYDDCRRELEVRRPSGHIFRFRVPQIGTYQVFAIKPQPDLDEIWVWTGTHGARRPNRRHRYSATGMYRGSKAA